VDLGRSQRYKRRLRLAAFLNVVIAAIFMSRAFRIALASAVTHKRCIATIGLAAVASWHLCSPIAALLNIVMAAIPMFRTMRIALAALVTQVKSLATIRFAAATL